MTTAEVLARLKRRGYTMTEDRLHQLVALGLVTPPDEYGWDLGVVGEAHTAEWFMGEDWRATPEEVRDARVCVLEDRAPRNNRINELAKWWVISTEHTRSEEILHRLGIGFL